MSDSYSDTIERVIRMYIDKGDVDNAILATEQLRGTKLSENELERLITELTHNDRYHEAVDIAKSQHATCEICDTIAIAIVQKEVRGNNIPIDAILSLNLSPIARERFLSWCSRFNWDVEIRDREYYRDLTYVERDQLVLFQLKRGPLDRLRATEIALAGVSKHILRKVFNALFQASILHVDILIAVAKMLQSQAAAKLLLSHFIMNGMYESALTTSRELRRGKMLSKNEFDECLKNSIANVLERRTFDEFQDLIVQIKNASEMQVKDACEEFLEAGRPLEAAQIAISIEDLDLHNRCIEGCIALDIISTDALLTTVFPLVEQGCSDDARENFFRTLMATRDPKCFEFAREQMEKGRLGFAEFNSALELGIGYWIKMDTPAFVPAYGLAKLSTEDSLLRINLRTIMWGIISDPVKKDLASLTDRDADLAFQILLENEEKFGPTSGEINLLIRHFFSKHQLGKVLKLAKWRGFPLAEDELQQIIMDNKDTSISKDLSESPTPPGMPHPPFPTST